MPGYYDHVNVLPGSVELDRGTGLILTNLGVFFGRWNSIVDIVSDPQNPLADYGDSANILYVKNTAIAWAVEIDNSNNGWAGTNRGGMVVKLGHSATGTVPPQIDFEVLTRRRLWIHPFIVASGYNRYSGILPVNAIMVGIGFENYTGDFVTINYSLFSVPWNNN